MIFLFVFILSLINRILAIPLTVRCLPLHDRLRESHCLYYMFEKLREALDVGDISDVWTLVLGAVRTIVCGTEVGSQSPRPLRIKGSFQVHIKGGQIQDGKA